MAKKMTSQFILLFVTMITTLALVGCGAGKDKTSVELIQDMMVQISLKAQDYDELRGEPSNRVPPANTVPRGYTPEKYATDPMAAGQNLKNPFVTYTGEELEKMLARGKAKYDVYCGICHGSKGYAAEDSNLKKYIPLIPPLVSEKVNGLKDGHIYHIITHGQGVMGAYGTQIPSVDDRWAIVNYIRTLK